MRIALIALSIVCCNTLGSIAFATSEIDVRREQLLLDASLSGQLASQEILDDFFDFWMWNSAAMIEAVRSAHYPGISDRGWNVLLSVFDSEQANELEDMRFHHELRKANCATSLEDSDAIALANARADLQFYERRLARFSATFDRFSKADQEYISDQLEIRYGLAYPGLPVVLKDVELKIAREFPVEYALRNKRVCADLVDEAGFPVRTSESDSSRACSKQDTAERSSLSCWTKVYYTQPDGTNKVAGDPESAEYSERGGEEAAPR